ncbi:MAG: VWA domain-containing protein, partial [Verrucomicrobiota bacterium]
QQSSFRKAFSMLELLLVVSLVGVLTALAMQQFGDMRTSFRQTKMGSDVQAVNSAIDLYLANGGSLAGVSDPQAVLNKLKTIREQSSAKQYAGFRESMIDLRLMTVALTPEEKSDQSLKKVLWNGGKNRFEIVTSGAGAFAGFGLGDLSSDLAGQPVRVEEARAASSIDYDLDSGWIWKYDGTANGVDPPAPSSIYANGDPTSPLGAPDASSRLGSPVLVTPPGSYDYLSFPPLVTIANPNPPSSSVLFYATSWNASGVNWQPYTSPIPLSNDQEILTYVKSLDGAFEDSFSSGGIYLRSAYELLPPDISASLDKLNLLTNDLVTVDLLNGNPDAIPHSIEYAINGGGFQDYTNPLTLIPESYPDGVLIEARAVSTEEDVVNSPIASRTIAPENFFGIPLKQEVVYVLDVSGSMATQNRLTLVKTEMNRIFDNLTNKQSFAVITFSKKDDLVIPYGKATTEFVSQARFAVNALTPGGPTNYEVALKRAKKVVEAKGAKQVIFLSDGEPTRGDKTTAGILSFVQGITDAGARLDALAFGGSISKKGQNLLKLMDEQGDVTVP